jgi:isoleucyl-tRNA synthetase
VSPEAVTQVSEDVARSPAAVPPDAVPSASMPGVWLAVRPTAAAKCVRCWHHRADVGAEAAHPELCGRCVGNLSMPGETRRHC